MKYFMIIIVLLFAATVQADIGSCIGGCASEQGICIGGCSGDGQCISRCNAAYGRCVARCHQQQGQQQGYNRPAKKQKQKVFDYTPQNDYGSNLGQYGTVD